FGAQVVCDRPADDLAAPGVEHDGEIEKPRHVSLPRKGHRVGLHIVLSEACSAFTRVAACTLARSPYFATRYPKDSDISSPPCLPRFLPAGAVAGWGLHPLESAALSRRTPLADLRGLLIPIGRAAPWHPSDR